ncbi:hypothetical protein JTB14_000541 [Gonioctena quinquepunctata]|nr:hypothetical protein JTB14_000541 [Gonioctena quinquepunctata]
MSVCCDDLCWLGRLPCSLTGTICISTHFQAQKHKQLKILSKQLRKTLDISCGSISLPAIENGKLFRLKRKKMNTDISGKKEYLVAEFKCDLGYSFKNLYSGKMFCSRSKWIGKLPICENEPTMVSDILQNDDPNLILPHPPLHFGECNLEQKSKCPNKCFIQNGESRCGCPHGFQEVDNNCQNINELDVPIVSNNNSAGDYGDEEYDAEDYDGEEDYEGDSDDEEYEI